MPRRTLATIVLLCFGPVVTAAGVGAGGFELRRVEDPTYGIRYSVPADWHDIGGGYYARGALGDGGAPPEELTMLAVDMWPTNTIDQLWPSLLTRFELDEVPARSGSHLAGSSEWTLYRFERPVADTNADFELALSVQDGGTGFVLLYTDTGELDTLHEQVLLPLLDSFEPLGPGSDPEGPVLGYRAEEVAFPGGARGIELAGTLTLPLGAGPHPVVVTMSGSGAQDRDAWVPGVTRQKPFAIIADALTSAGVGVLRYDDRGVGGSTGQYDSATIEDLAEDARAAVDLP